MRALLILLFGALASTAQDQPQKLNITTHELPNGLKLVLAEDHSRPVINLQVWYHVGSKDERPGRTGFAHLFEHMMFRGSKNVGPEEHMRLVSQAGGQVNAYTAFDQTVYWESFPSNYLDRMLWLEADRMSSLAITDTTFQKEREVVKEERRLRYENPPYGMLFERVLNALYQQYPYKHLPIGSMEDLNNATTADVQDFFNTYYVPNNATVVIVGDFDSRSAIAAATKYFGPIPRSKNPVPRVMATEPQQTELREVNAEIANAPLPVVVKAYHMPPFGHPDSYALDLASQILSAGQSSRLYKKLVYEDQSALAAQGQSQLLEGPSFFFAYGIINQGKDVKVVAEGLEAALERMRKEPVSADELAKAKQQVTSHYIIGRQRMQQKADALGHLAVLLGDPALYNTELDKYRKVTAADIQRVCAKYLVPSNETRVWITAAKPAAKSATSGSH
jgi:zinc protease